MIFAIFSIINSTVSDDFLKIEIVGGGGKNTIAGPRPPLSTSN